MKVDTRRNTYCKTNDLIDFFHERTSGCEDTDRSQADGSTWNQAMKPHWADHPMKER